MAFALAVALAAVPALAQVDEQQAVNNAANTVERMKANTSFQQDFQAQMQTARAVLIVPNLYKGGFILGGQYGNGVLLVRQANGSWSYPAFYTLEGGSLGLQVGIESTGILFIIRSEKALDAILSSQFKFGADVGITVVVFGAGMGAATTPNLTADIVAFAVSGVGLYVGVSLEGTAVSPRESWNAAYYGRDVSGRAVVLDNAATNTRADRLRDILAH
jgi:lipid-binding SYLF domain-containing protein